MLIGNKNKFAVEINTFDVIDKWIFGRFVFWINKKLIGTLDDTSVDLRGCINWLKDFVDNPRNRYESGLFTMDKDLIFLKLCHSVIPREQDSNFVKEEYKNIFNRFHITHLGMSSFDNVNILLTESKTGRQRLVWQQNQDEIEDYYLDTGEIQKTFRKVVGQRDQLLIKGK